MQLNYIVPYTMKNVLLITTDQQHYMTLGINNPKINTPNLDKLVERGINFERAYCTNPTCTPSRASIITGVYPSIHRAWTLGTKLDEKFPTIGEILQIKNITTSLIGKAHFQQLVDDENYCSLESYPILQDVKFWKNYKKDFYGFEHIKLLRNHTNESHVGQHYQIWLEEKAKNDWKNYFRKETGNVDFEEYCKEGISPLGQFPQGRAWDIPLDCHYNEFITSETIKTIDNAIDGHKSFFTWASYPDPHPDYLVPEPYASMYDSSDMVLPDSYYNEENGLSDLVMKTRERNPNFSEYSETGHYLHGCRSQIQSEESLKKDIALYYGMVTYIDDQIGKLIDKLKSESILDETLIIFTTDHGHYIGAHNLIRKGPFMYEDAIKIPFIVSGGGLNYKSTSDNSLVSQIDIFPTVAEYLSADYNPLDVQGKSLLALINGKVEKLRSGVICEFRHEPFKMNLRSYVTEQYKLTVLRGSKNGEIYDLVNDPSEMNNLWDNEKLRNSLMLNMIYYMMDIEPMHMPRLCGA